MKISGKKIKAIREAKGISRKELSKKSGIPIRTLEDWEFGKRSPRNFDIISELITTLEIDISDIYSDEYIEELHEKAVQNSTMLSNGSTVEELSLISTVEEIYNAQGISGLLKIIDRFIYHLGINKSIDIVEEVKNESNTN